MVLLHVLFTRFAYLLFIYFSLMIAGPKKDLIRANDEKSNFEFD